MNNSTTPSANEMLDAEGSSDAAAALHRALARMGAASSYGFRHDVAGGVTTYATGTPMARMNGISVNRSKVSGSFDSLEQSVRTLAGTGLPWTVQLFGRGELPAAVSRFISSSTSQTVPTYAVDISALPNTKTPEELEITAVRTASDRRDFGSVLGEAFGAGPDLGEPLVHPSTLQDKGVIALLGRVGGEPVATGIAVVDGMWCGVFAIATSALFRSRGYGAAMTLRLAHEGATRGARVAYLQASDMGEPIYRRLGFRDIHEDTDYVSLRVD